MKLFNLFKKETVNSKKESFQTLEKSQLSQVIGGGDDGGVVSGPVTDSAAKIIKRRLNIKSN